MSTDHNRANELKPPTNKLLAMDQDELPLNASDNKLPSHGSDDMLPILGLKGQSSILSTNSTECSMLCSQDLGGLRPSEEIDLDHLSSSPKNIGSATLDNRIKSFCE